MGKKKNPDAKPAEKMLMLYSMLLFNRCEMSLSELAEALNCSKQTVSRLIDQLEAAQYGKVVRVQRGREAVYFIEHPQLPQLSLDAESLELLALCHDFVRHLLPSGFQKNLDGTLRLAQAYTQADQESWAKEGDATAPLATRTVYKGRIDYSSKQDILRVIMRAIKTRKVCSLEYKSGPREDSHRFEFAPFRIIAFHETLRVQGWKVTDEGRVRPLYEHPITLPVQRIEKIEMGNRSAARLPIDEPQSTEAFGLMSDDIFTAQILFQPEAATYVAEREWSAEQHLTWREDGSLVLELKSQSWMELLAWVLSFGDSAKILAPDWFRLEAVGTIRNMARLYDLNQETASETEDAS